MGINLTENDPETTNSDMSHYRQIGDCHYVFVICISSYKHLLVSNTESVVKILKVTCYFLHYLGVSGTIEFDIC